MIRTNITKRIAYYVVDNDVNLSAMSRATGISYRILYTSLREPGRNRKLTVDEAYLVCEYLGKKIETFVDGK